MFIYAWGIGMLAFNIEWCLEGNRVERIDLWKLCMSYQSHVANQTRQKWEDMRHEEIGI